MAKQPRIRPLALCVVRHEGRVLLEHGYDSVKDHHFYRPIGGGIEFGERAIDAVRREFREEIDAELGSLRLLGVLENIFHFESQPGHEVVFIFESEFADPALNTRDRFVIVEGDQRGVATWMTLDEIREPRRPLYPGGLLELLSNRRN